MAAKQEEPTARRRRRPTGAETAGVIAAALGTGIGWHEVPGGHLEVDGGKLVDAWLEARRAQGKPDASRTARNLEILVRAYGAPMPLDNLRDTWAKLPSGRKSDPWLCGILFDNTARSLLALDDVEPVGGGLSECSDPLIPFVRTHIEPSRGRLEDLRESYRQALIALFTVAHGERTVTLTREQLACEGYVLPVPQVDLDDDW